MNAFNFGPSLSTIALYSIAFDSDQTFFLTLLPVCNHTDRKFISTQFLLSNFKFQAVNGYNIFVSSYFRVFVIVI